MADDVVINIRTKGGRQAAREADAATAGIIRLGRAGATAAVGLGRLGSSATSAASRGLRAVGSQARYAGVGIGAIGALSVRSGIQFNAMMEQQEVSFTNLLGSSQAARQEMTWLRKAAASTPFTLPGITDAAKQLSAYGFNIKQTNGLLTTLADASAGVGATEDQMNSVVRAIGQIRGKGSLQVEELNQIMEAAPGILDRGKLAKNLGITSAQLGNVGNEGVSAGRAIRAIQKAMADTFGGQAAKQAATFNGQMSTLHDNVQQTLGAITKPGFDALEKQVLPALNASSGALSKIFGRKDIDLAQKITLSRGVLRRNLGPIATEAENELRSLHLGDKLEHEFEVAFPRIANAAARGAGKAAGAFLVGWWHAGIWGKLFTVAVLGSKLGVFSTLGKMAAARFAAGAAANAAGGAAAGAAGKGLLGRLGGAGGAAALASNPVGWGIAGGAAVGLGAGKLLGLGPFAKDGPTRSRIRATDRTSAALLGQQLGLGHPAQIGRYYPAPPVHVYVDGKEVSTILAKDPKNAKTIAGGVAQQASNAKARRGR